VRCRDLGDGSLRDGSIAPGVLEWSKSTMFKEELRWGERNGKGNGVVEMRGWEGWREVVTCMWKSRCARAASSAERAGNHAFSVRWVRSGVSPAAQALGESVQLTRETRDTNNSPDANAGCSDSLRVWPSVLRVSAELHDSRSTQRLGRERFSSRSGMASGSSFGSHRRSRRCGGA
jgi:hypothetical protein